MRTKAWQICTNSSEADQPPRAASAQSDSTIVIGIAEWLAERSQSKDLPGVLAPTDVMRADRLPRPTRARAMVSFDGRVRQNLPKFAPLYWAAIPAGSSLADAEAPIFSEVQASLSPWQVMMSSIIAAIPERAASECASSVY